MMENEYVFNYDEVKRRFESVPQTNSTTKKFKSTTYKTRFQPRTKSITEKVEGRSNVSGSVASDKSSRQDRLLTTTTTTSPTVTFQVHVIRVQQIVPVEQISLQMQPGFYVTPNLVK
jgi:hypothetical protein